MCSSGSQQSSMKSKINSDSHFVLFSKLSKVNMATVDKGDPKVHFSIATTPKCWGGLYSFPWIALLYP